MSDEYRLDLNGDDGDTVGPYEATCARCNAKLEVTDATADEVAREHGARCFVPGDFVRGAWNNGIPVTIEGRVLCVGVENAGGRLPIDIDIVLSNVFLPGPRGFLIERSWLERIYVRPPIVHRDVKPENAIQPPTVKPEPVRGLSAEGQATYDRLRAEYGTLRPDGFSQSQVDAAKAVLLSKVERRR